MADLINVKGLAELQKFLDQLTPKMEKNVVRGGLRAGANVIKPVAQANIHSVSGELAKGLKVGSRGRGGTVTATLKTTGPHAFVAKWVEYGTRPHIITSRDANALSIGGVAFVNAVQHPGAQPHPFLRPALDTQAQAAVVAVGNYIRDRLATKLGLDAADAAPEDEESGSGVAGGKPSGKRPARARRDPSVVRAERNARRRLAYVGSRKR